MSTKKKLAYNEEENMSEVVENIGEQNSAPSNEAAATAQPAEAPAATDVVAVVEVTKKVEAEPSKTPAENETADCGDNGNAANATNAVEEDTSKANEEEESSSSSPVVENKKTPVSLFISTLLCIEELRVDKRPY